MGTLTVVARRSVIFILVLHLGSLFSSEGSPVGKTGSPSFGEDALATAGMGLPRVPLGVTQGTVRRLGRR